MLISELDIWTFAEKLASKEPVPGGGGVAALVGALGAALSSMVGSCLLYTSSSSRKRL